MKSGEFARLCNTTKNTLIHYDQLGLLRPSLVHENGYRDYSAADFARFSSIRAFVDAGFSLAQTKEFLQTKDVEQLGLFAQETQEVLAQRRRELERSERLLKELARQADAYVHAETQKR